MNFYDAHCHLASLAEEFDVQSLIQDAANHGITGFVSSALTRKEIAWHKSNHNPAVLWQAGVHPNFPYCDITIRDIRKLAMNHDLNGIGEIGLDRNNPDVKNQIIIFEKQLRLAEEFGQLVVLHLVGHPQEALNLMRQYELTYFIHGYAGSVESFREFCKLGCYFTISSRLLKPDKHDLLMAMLDYGKVMFETDMTIYYVNDYVTNPLLKLIDLVERVSRISGISIAGLAILQEKVYDEHYRNHDNPF